MQLTNISYLHDLSVVTVLTERPGVLLFTVLKYKSHFSNNGNELTVQLAKEAASDDELDITYNKYAKSAVNSELKDLGLQKWQSEWDSSNRGAITKTFFSPQK